MTVHKRRAERPQQIAVWVAVAAVVTLLIGCPIDMNGNGTDPVTSPTIGTLVSVPGGTFQRDGLSTNTTTVSPFRMSVHEITRSQFLAIMGTDPSDESRSTGSSDPVQRVSWYHAIAFCNKLSIAEGRTPVYSVGGINWATLAYADIPTTNNATWNAATMNMAANGYRLPTEAEWMWAAMGADQDAQPGAMQGGINRTGYVKPFAGYDGSNSIGDYAVYRLNSGPGDTGGDPATTRPVGTREPNELGLCDMSGNVWEWTWDRAANYPSGSLDNPTGPDSGGYRVIRGGSFLGDAFNCTTGFQASYEPRHWYINIGFRVVSR